MRKRNVEQYKNYLLVPAVDPYGVEVYTIQTLEGQPVGETYDFYAEAIEAIEQRI